jgi:hypothetical protein
MVCNISLESFQQGLQLCLRTNLHQKFTKEIMGFQSGGSPNFGNFGIPDLGVPRKMTFGCSPVVNHKNNIRGKVVASSNFGPW